MLPGAHLRFASFLCFFGDRYGIEALISLIDFKSVVYRGYYTWLINGKNKIGIGWCASSYLRSRSITKTLLRQYLGIYIVFINKLLLSRDMWINSTLYILPSCYPYIIINYINLPRAVQRFRVIIITIPIIVRVKISLRRFVRDDRVSKFSLITQKVCLRSPYVSANNYFG